MSTFKSALIRPSSCIQTHRKGFDTYDKSISDLSLPLLGTQRTFYRQYGKFTNGIGGAGNVHQASERARPAQLAISSHPGYMVATTRHCGLGGAGNVVKLPVQLGTGINCDASLGGVDEMMKRAILRCRVWGSGRSISGRHGRESFSYEALA